MKYIASAPLTPSLPVYPARIPGTIHVLLFKLKKFLTVVCQN